MLSAKNRRDDQKLCHSHIFSGFHRTHRRLIRCSIATKLGTGTSSHPVEHIGGFGLLDAGPGEFIITHHH